MDAESMAPTPVGTVPKGLKGHVAHGPEKEWEKVGKTVPVQLTAPVELVQWLRSNGYVLSRVFQEAGARLMNGGDLDRIGKQIEFHREQVTILEAALSKLKERRDEMDAVASAERARLAEIQELTALFWEEGRGDSRHYSRRANLAWLEGRVSSSKSLRGSSAEDILDLVLAGGDRPDGNVRSGQCSRAAEGSR